MSDTDHAVTIEPEPDSDGLIVWRCTCGVWGTDYDRDEADASIDLHLDGKDSTR